ncbi:hypothetical protein LZ554_002015 [Drepanopeziza brunnea f. sp. 'monogermtubi']|nr:hypothetical protein LZ554_002015 [Drepanopeziza brunnea f. sp. 'monogermtubi']
MLFINALLAAATFAITTAQGDNYKRIGKILLCRNPDYKICADIPYNQDICTSIWGMGGIEIDNSMTSFDTYGYGCEFFKSETCDGNDGSFAHRGAVKDLLTDESGKYADFNDAVSSFRCGT